MIGSFNDVFIWVSPRIQDGSIWSIDAKQVSYEIDAQGVAKLSIVTRRSVKVEPQDDGARSGCTTLFSTPVEEKSSDDARKTANCAHGVSPMSPPPKRPKIIPHEPNKNPEGSKADVSAAVSSKKRVTKATLKKQTGVKLNTHSAPGGAVSSKSGTNVRSWNLCSVPGCVQRAGGGRRCWRHGSVGCCSVEDCSTPSQGIVAASDHFGPPGRRCRRHGGYKLCDVAGCNTSFQSFIPTSDAFGPSGRRCRRHGGYTLCNVEGCTRPSQVTAKNADTFGLPGRRCLAHRIVVPKRRPPPRTTNGRSRKCNVVECTSMSFGATTKPDTYGNPGRRCKEHGGTRGCNVAQGTVAQADNFGHPGKRCVKHGGRCCNVEGCTSASQDIVAEDDAFGSAGKRCRRHGGFKRCNVQNCMKVVQGRIAEDDAFGVAGRRCFAHGAKRSRAKPQLAAE
eukprot:GEMP01023455.1.p1 GENE.GEMP01023455.1~~GEMP01023455.1.p1  ORF type:complete len:449 (+),score=68.28 GEMP01023455.1:102-1448(+)